MELQRKHIKRLSTVTVISALIAGSCSNAQDNLLPIVDKAVGIDNAEVGDIHAKLKRTLSANFEDMNQDGFPDVVVLDEKARTLSVYVSNGDGTLQDPSVIPDRHFSIPSLNGTNPLLYSDDVYTVGDDTAMPRCDKNTQGLVKLKIDGNPGDTFRHTLKCDGIVVAECYATLPNKPTCTDGPKPVPEGGIEYCTIGEGNGNSNVARIVYSSCS